MRMSTLKKGCSDVPIRATGNIHCALYIPTSLASLSMPSPSPVSRSRPIRVTILTQLCHDPASVVSRSCPSCVTILPQLCHFVLTTFRL